MIHAEAAAVMNERSGLRPRVGVVLGSGLGAVAEAVADPTTIDYSELPGFPVPSVAGHGGQAVLGEIGDVPVAVLQGRAHVYEGGDLQDFAPQSGRCAPPVPRSSCSRMPRARCGRRWAPEA